MRSLKRLCCFFILLCVLLAVFMKSPSTFTANCILPQTASNERNTTTDSLALTSRPFVARASLVHWYGDINWNAYFVWIVYHYRRWNVAKIDFYLPESEIDKAKARLKDIEHVKIYYHTHRLNEFEGRYQIQIFNEALHNAQVDGDDVLMNLDADEFLTSKHYKSLKDILEAANNKAAVTFPMLKVDYRICSSAKQVFGSATYSQTHPAQGTLKNNTQGKEYYVPPAPGCSGHRKYLVQPAMWDRIAHIHDPIMCKRQEVSPLIHDMTGYETQSGDLRIHHIRTGKGIHAETEGLGCSFPTGCEFLGLNLKTCVENVTDAAYMKVDSVFAPYDDLANTPLIDSHKIGDEETSESRRKLFTQNGRQGGERIAPPFATSKWLPFHTS